MNAQSCGQMDPGEYIAGDHVILKSQNVKPVVCELTVATLLVHGVG